MSRKVLVVGEVRDGSLRNVSYETIAAGKTVAEGGEVVGVLIGDAVKDLGKDMIQYGADRVAVVEDEKLKSYSSDGFSQALLAVVESEKPDSILISIRRLVKTWYKSSG